MTTSIPRGPTLKPCRSSPGFAASPGFQGFAALHRVTGGRAEALEQARLAGLAEAKARKALADRVSGWHALADAIESGACDDGSDQFSDWGHHRGAECALENRARLASQLLEFQDCPDAEPDIKALCQRMGWLWRGRIQWATLRNVAARRSESQMLDDARLNRTDIRAGATLPKALRVNTSKLRAAELAGR